MRAAGLLSFNWLTSARGCRHINKLIEGFKNVDEQREAYGSVMVPMEVLERLDKMEGDNDPSLYTKQTLERIVFDADALERTNAGCVVCLLFLVPSQRRVTRRTDVLLPIC